MGANHGRLQYRPVSSSGLRPALDKRFPDFPFTERPDFSSRRPTDLSHQQIVEKFGLERLLLKGPCQDGLKEIDSLLGVLVITEKGGGRDL